MKLCTDISDQQACFNKLFVSNVSRLPFSAEAPLKCKAVPSKFAEASPKFAEAPPNNLIGWLNRILAEEVRCVMQYRTHYFLTLSHPEEIASVFLMHSNEKLLHVDAIALQIARLGGIPDFSFGHLCDNAYGDAPAKCTLHKLIEKNLSKERVIINSYRSIINHLLASDLTAGNGLAISSMLENILFADEQRVHELVCWLGEVLEQPNLIARKNNATNCVMVW